MVLALLLLLSMLAGCGTKEAKSDYETVKANGTLKIGITNFAPMDYPDENGDWTGFDAELARKVAADLGLSVEFMEIDWDNKIMELTSGNIDCVWNGMTLIYEVKKSMSCTEPYVLNSQVVVMPKDKAAQYPDVQSIAGLNLAVEAGSAAASAAADNGLTNLVEVDKQATALMEVAAGTSDACIIDKTMAEAMTGEFTSYSSMAVAFVLCDEEYGIGFRPGSDLTAMVNELLEKYRADGSLQALADKYGLSLAK